MRILIASHIHPDAIAELRSRHDVVCAFSDRGERLRALLADREALVFRSGVELNASLLAAAPRLRALIRAGSGLDNLDLEYVRRRNLSLIILPGPGAVAVAELAFGLMLALSRNIVKGHSLLCAGRWAKADLIGHLLGGRTLGIIGVGTIGTEVARRALAWGMRVIGCVEHMTPERSRGLRDAGVTPTPLDRLLEEADLVSLHVPLKDSTRHLIDSRALSRMKAGSFLINLARGGVVDEAALYEELTTPDRLAGAALDVHERGEGDFVPALAALPNVILTPHLGGSTFESQRALGCEIVGTIDSLASLDPSTIPSPPVASARPGRGWAATGS